MSRNGVSHACGLATVLLLGSACLLSGCGSGEEAPMAAKISPEMQKQQDEMLQNYGKQAAERGRSERQKNRR